MAGEHCGRWCGWCGRCDACYEPGPPDPSIRQPRADDLPVPIPNLGKLVEAEKARRRTQQDEQFQKAVTREFSKPSAA